MRFCEQVERVLLGNIFSSWRVVSQLRVYFVFVHKIDKTWCDVFVFHWTYFTQSKSWQSCWHCYFSSFSPERRVNSSFLSPNTIQSTLTTPSSSDSSDLVFAVPHNCAQQWLRNCSNFSFRTTVFSISDDSYCNGLGNFGPSRAGGFALFSMLERKSHLLRPKTQYTIRTIESNNHTNNTFDLIF